MNTFYASEEIILIIFCTLLVSLAIPTVTEPDGITCGNNAHYVVQGEECRCICNSGYVGDGFQCEGNKEK